MANIFPQWMNWLPLKAGVVLSVLAVGVVAAATYYLPPSYSAVGYRPEQPVPFSHKIHVEQNGMDCRYCHSFADRAAHSNVPTGETCWGCHEYIKRDSPKLVNLRRSMDETYEGYDGKPIVWTQIHRSPDYVKFNHSAHINRGISCVECHGRVDQMEVVYQDKTLSMGFCLECHRNPEDSLRPLEQVTNLGWEAGEDYRLGENVGVTSAERFKASEARIESLTQEMVALEKTLKDYENQIKEAKEEPQKVQKLYKKLYAKQKELDALVVKIEDTKADSELYAKVMKAWEKQDKRNASAAQIEGLDQEEIGLFLKKAWNVNPPIQCGGCHR